MYNRVKLGVLAIVVWFFATILFLIYILSNTVYHDEYPNADEVKRIIQQQSNGYFLHEIHPIASAENNEFFYEKYRIAYKKMHRLDALLKTMLKVHQQPSDDYFGFNVTRSNEISVTRKVNVYRAPECTNRKFNYSSLPTLSVITPFHNEALTTLLRHVHAILARTPPQVLLEIILVDDNSTFSYLGDDLQEYFRILDSKIQIVRNKMRKGLILSRLAGAEIAKGEVISFLDAHMEVCDGWSEPLLDRISSQTAIVVQPDVIDIYGNTFKLSNRTIEFRGCFGWDMSYNGCPLPQYLHQIPRTDWDPLPFPVLVGSCIVIRRSYFNALGRFDSGLQIWGGEQYDLSFNVWMTGGRVETFPCSKVGHIFKASKYSFGFGGKNYVVAKNLLRVAEVWMDEYKEIARRAVRGWQNPLPVFSEADWDSIKERQKLRKRRQSKSFDWFLKNIIPEYQVPEKNDLYFGEIINLQTWGRFYVTKDGYIGMTGRYSIVIIPENTFSLDTFGRLKYKSKCVGVDEITNLLRIDECHLCVAENRTWPYWSMEGRQLVFNSPLGTLCATQANSAYLIHRGLEVVQLQTCNKANKIQEWDFMFHLIQQDLPYSP